MTQNQIRLAEHNETVRHNQETERQGWYTASTDALYKDRTGRANLEQSAAATSNARSNSENVQVNWYRASTDNQSMLNENYYKLGYLTYLKDKVTKDYEVQKEQNQIARDEWNTKRILGLANVAIARQNAETAAKNAATQRGSMWFNAAGQALNYATTQLSAATHVFTHR